MHWWTRCTTRIKLEIGSSQKHSHRWMRTIELEIERSKKDSQTWKIDDKIGEKIEAKNRTELLSNGNKDRRRGKSSTKANGMTGTKEVENTIDSEQFRSHMPLWNSGTKKNKRQIRKICEHAAIPIKRKNDKDVTGPRCRREVSSEKTGIHQMCPTRNTKSFYTKSNWVQW